MRGELDIATGPILREHLGSYDGSSSSGGDSPRVVHLLSKLEFMDCRSVLYRLTAVNGHGPETITIREPSQAVHRFLPPVGMNSLIEADS